MKQALGFFIALFILAYFGWYFSHPKVAVRLDDKILATTADATATKLFVRQFNAQGVLINAFSAPLMQHIPQGDRHTFTNPHAVVTQDNQPPWDIRALKATSYDGGKHITFLKNVVVHQSAGEKTQESTLRTEKVIYYPKEKRASTDLLVTYEQAGNTLESTGMNAYLNEKKIELLHHMRGSYAPAKG